MATPKEEQQAKRIEQNEANQKAQDEHVGEKDADGLLREFKKSKKK